MMVSADTRSKNMTIVKYAIITLLILGFCLFYLIFSLNFISESHQII